MAASATLHPVFRYGTILACVFLACATVLASGITAPHSAAWLAAIYVTVFLIFASIRSSRTNPKHKSYSLYLFILLLYLWIVWFLHITPHDPTLHNQLLWMNYFTGVGSIYMAPALYYFSLQFFDIQNKPLRWISYLGWLAATGFWVTNFTGDFILGYQWAGYLWVPKMKGYYVPFFHFTSGYVMLSVLVPLAYLFITKNSQKKLQLIYYLIGATPVWLFCWGHFLMSLGINMLPVGGICFLLHALILGYAVLKPNIFDVSIVIRRGLAYAGVSMVLGIFYGLLLWATAQFGFTDSMSRGILPGIGIVLFAGLVYAPLLSRLQNWIDQWFFRSDTDRQKQLDSFMKETQESLDLQRVSEGLCTLLAKTLHPQGISIYLANNEKQNVLFGQYKNSFVSKSWPKGAKPNPDLAIIFTGTKNTHRFHKDVDIQRSENLVVSCGTEHVAVPLIHRDETLGCIILEPKKADEEYSADDIRFAEMAANHCGAALLNARSFTQLEDLQKLTDQTLQGLTAGVLVIAENGTIKRFNKTGKEILTGLSKASLNSLSDLESVHPELTEILKPALESKKSIKNTLLELETNPTKHILVATKPMENEEEKLLLVILHDITDYKRLEATAHRREHLAQVGEMISSINHEIKNIIQPLPRQIRKLEEADKDSEEEKAVSIMNSRLQSLDRLVAGLKDLSRPIEIRMRPVNLSLLVDSVWNDVSGLPQANNIHFSKEVSVEKNSFRADGQWLRQVLYNFLRNAAEAVSENNGNSENTIYVEGKLSDDTVTIRIQDSGIGMDEAQQKRLFEPFFSTKSDSGTGLGLNISRKIIDLHGGTITVESQKQNGTTFTIRLPQTQTSSA